MKEVPYFSIVIPLYNKQEYVKATLLSVIYQSFREFEVIVIDDGSTDASTKIVESLDDSRIRLIRQDNGGPSTARNRGIKEAKGKYIAFLDADDEWLPDKLEMQRDLLSANPELAWVCSAYRAIGRHRTKDVIHSQAGVLSNAVDAIIDGLSIWTSTVVVRSDVFQDECLLFNNEVWTSEDREVWYKLACMYPTVGYIGTVSANYNAGMQNSLTSNALRDVDLSFLSVSERLEDVFDLLDSERRKRFLCFLSSLNVKFVISIWIQTSVLDEYLDVLEPHIDHSLLAKLVKWQGLPRMVKRTISKSRIFV